MTSESHNFGNSEITRVLDMQDLRDNRIRWFEEFINFTNLQGSYNWVGESKYFHVLKDGDSLSSTNNLTGQENGVLIHLPN